MEIVNESGETVFIRSGTLFRGATQERALQRSVVAFAGKNGKMPVRCVHASRGINPNAKTTYGGLTPLNFDQMNYSHGYKPAEQHVYWSNVQHATTNFCKLSGVAPSVSVHNSGVLRGQVMSRMSSSLNVHSGDVTTGGPVWGSGLGYMHSEVDEVLATPDMAAFIGNQSVHKMDDLASHQDAFALKFDDILSKIKLQTNQAGLALITDGGVQTIEVFDHPDSWKALHESAVKRMGAELVKDDSENVFEFKPENANKMVCKVLALDWARNTILEHRPTNGEPKVVITGLSSGDYVGELVELNDQVAHLVVLKKAA